MKIGLLQVNTTVGAMEANAELLLREYRVACQEGAELVLAPELALNGYPPRDLISRGGFLEATREALRDLAEQVGEVPLLVGHIEEACQGSGPKHLNAVSWLEAGAIRKQTHKTRLPNYDVFDEQRYFRPLEAAEIWEMAGCQVGVTICEDIWTEDFLPAPLYDRDPAAELVAAGAEIILNLSASPYHATKNREREAMLSSVAKQHGRPVVYCNLVGGNDELVFDGHSLALDGAGEVMARLPGFQEATEVIDLAGPKAEAAAERLVPADVFQALVLGVRDYVRKCGFKTVVLGLSGGIDSALTAVVAAEAVGPQNVLGVLMPSEFSSRGSLEDAEALVKSLGIASHTVPIKKMNKVVRDSLKGVFEGQGEDTTEENIQSRLRGLTLMAVSNKLGHLLLTTGNKSELAVGYCTIYGDMCGGLAVISDVPKTLVFEMARWVNRDCEIIPWSTIDKPPSAELRPNQTDQDTLPPYEILDEILEWLVEQQASVAQTVEAGLEEELVRWVARKVEQNEWKRRQAAPGLRVTSKAFGMGRRIPLAQRFGREASSAA
ncbi:MAG: NAD+ synthase [Verrucomicrobiota bacterium]